MFDLTPFKYLVEGLLGNAIGGYPVRCDPKEFNQLTPPQGQTCQEFLSPFSSTLDQAPNGSGYFQNAADGSGNCDFCQYRVGGE